MNKPTTKPTPPPLPIIPVNLKDITVGERRRPLDHAKVVELAASLAEHGQLQLIAVREKGTFGGFLRRALAPCMNSGDEGDKKVCRKKDQMDRPLHQVSATCAKSDGAHQERYHEHSDVLGLQPQY